HKQAPDVEWQLVESDADWERLQTPSLPDRASDANRRPRLQRYLWGVTGLLLLLASVGGWEWHTDQGRTHPAAAEATTMAQPALVGASTLVALPQPGGEGTAPPQWELRAFAPKTDPSV